MERLARKCILKIKPYVPGKPIEEVERELGGYPDVTSGWEAIKLASNENPFSPPSGVLKAIREYLPKLNRYPDDHGYYLTGALAKKYRVKQENIILGCGSDEIMELVSKTFLEPDEEVIFGDQSFVMYKIITQIMGGKPVAVPLKNYTYDLIAIRRAVTKKTKIVFIANPNNPTGTIVCDKEVRQFIRNMPKNIIIVFDEAYAEYVESKDYPRSLEIVQENRNCVMLRTFSKICSLAGLRIGYGIANPQLIACLNRVRLPFNTSNIAQVAALASLKETKWMERIRRINREEKKFLYSEFGKMGLEYIPSEANFILVKIGRDAPGAAQGLLKKGIIVRVMTDFGFPEYVRVTIGRPVENKKFVKALKQCIS